MRDAKEESKQDMDRQDGDVRSANTPNVIQSSMDRFLRGNGFAKKSGSWYRHGDTVTVVVNLQKSQYGPSYYLNVALSINELAGQPYPKENQCHIRTRVERLVPSSRQALVRELLDLETPLSDDERASELVSLLSDFLGPIADGVTGTDGLRSAAGEAMISASLVTGDALDWLDSAPGR